MAARLDAISFDRWSAAVVAEFGEPAGDVVRGMRAAGNSWAVIAGALDVPEKRLRTWARQYGWHDGRRNWANAREANSLETRARRLGYDSLRAMLADYYMAGLTRRDAARALNCNHRSFSSAMPGGLDLPPRPTTPAQRASRRASISAINARRLEARNRARAVALGYRLGILAVGGMAALPEVPARPV